MKVKSFVIVALIGLMVVFSNGAALAATAEVTTSMDIATDLNPAGWTTAVSNLAAYTNYAVGGNTSFAFGWQTGSVSQPLVPVPGQIQATASATYPGPGDNLTTHAFATGNSNVVLAESYRSGTFTVGADSRLTLSGIYHSSTSLQNVGAGETAFGWSIIRISLQDTTHPVQNVDLKFEYPWASGVGVNTLGASGAAVAVTDPYIFALNIPFTYVVPFSAGDSGTFELYTRSVAQTTAPVPIPGALWLLGSGLVGLVGIRRRFWK